MPTDWLLGSGGHAKVVMDALASDPRGASVQFADDSTERVGTQLMGRRVCGPISQVVNAGSGFHVAIGANAVRQRLHLQWVAAGCRPFKVIHRAANVSPYANVGEGCFVAAGAIVAAMATVGQGVIVNHGAIVDHDCTVGDFCHVAPNATLSGGVTLGVAVFVGSGACVLPGVRVGDGAVVGAGAVVREDVPAGQLVAGVPARMKKDSDRDRCE